MRQSVIMQEVFVLELFSQKLLILLPEFNEPDFIATTENQKSRSEQPKK